MEIIFEALENGFYPWDMKLDNWGVLQSQRVVAIDFDSWQQGAFNAPTMRMCLQKLLQDAANNAANTWMGEHLRQGALPYLESLTINICASLCWCDLLSICMVLLERSFGCLCFFSYANQTSVSFVSHVLQHYGCITSIRLNPRAIHKYRGQLLEILTGAMRMARNVESTMGFEDVASSHHEIGPMTWHEGQRTQAVAMANYPALLVSCETSDDHGNFNTDAKFVVMFLGVRQTESGLLPVVQVMARCQNMILLPKMVLLRMEISGDGSSFAKVVSGETPYTELVPTRFMHLKRDFVWNTVQSVISWDEDRQRVAARLKQVIPFVGDEDVGSFSDEVSQDTLTQLEGWFDARFQVVGNPPKVIRKLEGAPLLRTADPPPPKEERKTGPLYPPHAYFSTQEPRWR